MKRTVFFASVLFVVLSVHASSASAAGSCCSNIVTGTGQEYRLEHTVVSEPVQQTSYRKVRETSYVEEEVTTYETVWETQQRERRYTVARSVPETSVVEKRYTFQRPVEETEYRDTSYTVKKRVPETSMREEKVLVPKQVFETQQREVREVRRVPVEETVIQERVYTTNRPVTTFETKTVDRGGYVNQVATQPGKTYHRLAWQRVGDYVDSTSGGYRVRVPGLHWVPMHGAERQTTSRVYQPNYVSETVPITTFIPEQRIEQIPVTKTTYRDETVSRMEEYQVARTIHEEQIRQIPVTTYKEVLERVEQTTPVKVQRMITEERVEKVPQTVYRTVTEERVEPYEVKVARVVPVTRTVKKPVITEKWVPYTQTVNRQRVVVNRVPINSAINTIVSGTTTSPTLLPGERVISVTDQPATATPLAKPETYLETASEVTTDKVDKAAESDPADKKPVVE